MTSRGCCDTDVIPALADLVGAGVALGCGVTVAAGVAAGLPLAVVGAGVTAPGPGDVAAPVPDDPMAPVAAPVAATLVEATLVDATLVEVSMTAAVSELATTVDGTLTGTGMNCGTSTGTGMAIFLTFLMR